MPRVVFRCRLKRPRRVRQGGNRAACLVNSPAHRPRPRRRCPRLCLFCTFPNLANAPTPRRLCLRSPKPNANGKRRARHAVLSCSPCGYICRCVISSSPAPPHAAAAFASGVPCAVVCAPPFSNRGTTSPAASGVPCAVAVACKCANRAARSSCVNSSARAQTERNRADITPDGFAPAPPSVTHGNAATADFKAASDS